MRPLRLLICIIAMALADLPLHAQRNWDAVLDRYERIVLQCKDLRERISEGKTVREASLKEVVSEMENLRKQLQKASGAMTADQKQRFERIKDSYKATGGAKAAPSEAKDKPKAALVTKSDEFGATKAARMQAIKPISSNTSYYVSHPLSFEPDRELSLMIPTRANPVSSLARRFSTRSYRQSQSEFSSGTEYQAGQSKLSFFPAVAGTVTINKTTGYGLTAFIFGRKTGLYLSATDSFNHSSAAYEITSSGDISSGGKFWGDGSGKSCYRFISGGALARTIGNLYVYSGAGYSESSLLWRDSSGAWARVQDLSNSGVELQGGITLRLGHLLLLGGLSCPLYSAGWRVGASIGAGISF